MRHRQLEPIWGGTTDTAWTLRGACALAIVQCRQVNSHRLFVCRIPHFVDKETSVRVNAARAIEQVGTDSATLLLRLRAELAFGEPEVLGACYSGVLALEGPAAISGVAGFLAVEDDAAAEAAVAIALTHSSNAVEVLCRALREGRDPWYLGTVLSALALTRQQEATNWLLELIGREDRHAAEVGVALCRSAASGRDARTAQGVGQGCGQA